MPEFICKVADASGRVFEEREAAESEQDVRRKLGERGLLVFSVSAGGGLVAQVIPALRAACDGVEIVEEPHTEFKRRVPSAVGLSARVTRSNTRT